MSIYSRHKPFVLIFVLGPVTACGNHVPEVQEFWEPHTGRWIESAVKKRVYCELQAAVAAIVEDNKKSKDHALDWFSKWGAQVTLDLTIDETGAVNPGVAFNVPLHAATTNFVGEYLAPSASPGTPGSVLAGKTFPFLSTPQSYSLGLGGTFSSHAQRIDKFNFYYTIAGLVDHPQKNADCYEPIPNKAERVLGLFKDDPNAQTSSPLLESELKIEEWLRAALFIENIDNTGDPYPAQPNSQEKKLAPEGNNGKEFLNQNVMSYEVHFDIVSSANVTPTWKLVRVSANTGTLPLFSAYRNRSHDLLITFGPKKRVDGHDVPDDMAAAAHSASETGNANANALRNLNAP